MYPQGDVPDTPKMLRALYNAVISSSVEDEEDEEALKLLAELLAEEGVDPNAGDEVLWRAVSPFFVSASSCFIEHTELNLELRRDFFFSALLTLARHLTRGTDNDLPGLQIVQISELGRMYRSFVSYLDHIMES